MSVAVLAGGGASARRIGAVVLRHLYLLRSSWPRVVELMYWPTVQMILWGLITSFLMTNSTWVAQASGVLLAGVILWDVLFRGQLGLCAGRDHTGCGVDHNHVVPIVAQSPAHRTAAGQGHPPFLARPTHENRHPKRHWARYSRRS